MLVLNEELNKVSTEQNSVKISNDVIAIIAGIAAGKIEGVVSMNSGITGGITEMLGMKNLSKGVKVEVNKNEATIDLFITVEYGVKLSEVGKNVQENVKETVENMTGLQVIAVNVNIQDVSFPKLKEEKEIN